jgi:hypothetical protein
MNRHLVASLILAGAMLAPIAAAAATYTFKVPVQLSRVQAPAGTIFQIARFVSSDSKPADPLPSGNYVGRQTFVNLPPLKSDGSVSATIPVAITVPATAPQMKSYICGLMNYSYNQQVRLSLTQTADTSNGAVISNYVTGKLP